MKKLLTVAGIGLLALVMNNAKAQQRDMIGIKGGVSLTSVTNFDGRPRFTGHGGVFYHHEINKAWCIQPEVLYAGEGQKFTNDLDQKRVLALNYLQVPVMVQYFPVKHLYFEFGPQVSFLLDAKAKDVNTDHNDVNNLSVNYRKAEFGVNAGVGVNVNNNFGIYGRYNLGVTDISKNNTPYMANRGMQFGALVRF